MQQYRTTGLDVKKGTVEMKLIACVCAAFSVAASLCGADDAQVNEAAAVFDGVKGAPPVNSGNGVIRLKLGGLRLWS